MRTVTSIAMIGLGLSCAGCGDHNPAAPSTTRVTAPPTLTVQQIIIASNAGPTTLRVGQTLQLHATARLSDG